jgi:hypothetical protein
MKVCHALQLPDDMQKISRLLQGAARIWWRQHERSGSPKARSTSVETASTKSSDEAVELCGTELKERLQSSDSMYQLMFSAVMLHWFVHNDGSEDKRDLDFATWRSLTLQDDNKEVTETVLRSIHSLICRQFISEFAIAISGKPSVRQKVHGGDEGGGRGIGDEHARKGGAAVEQSSLSQFSSDGVTGWVRIVGGGFFRLSDKATQAEQGHRHESSIFSEVSAASHQSQGLHCLRNEGARKVQPTQSETDEAMGCRGDGLAWLSIFYNILFFSTSQRAGAPYAFLQLPQVRLTSIKRETQIITLTGKQPESSSKIEIFGSSPLGPPANASSSPATESAGSPGTVTTPATAAGNSPSKTTPVNVVLLLPDGRWQELKLPLIELQLQSETELDAWIGHFSKGEATSSTSDIWLEVM